MALQFFFKYKKTLIKLPVNPGVLNIKTPGNNKTVEIVQTGEVNLLRKVKLAECTIESFFPVNADAPYVLTAGEFKAPKYYIDFFNQVRTAKKPLQLLVSDTDINMLVSIETFEYELNAQDDDTSYTLELKEYKPHQAKVLKVTTGDKVVKSKSSTRDKTGFSIGDTVIVTGNYWYTSYGANPHGSFKNFEGKISHIVTDKTRVYRYHITTLTGGYRGWVKASQITHK